MPNEDIEIRITRRGEIFVKIEGSTEQRIRDYQEFLSEVIGPVHGATPIRRPDWERPASIDSEQKEEREQELGG